MQDMNALVKISEASSASSKLTVNEISFVPSRPTDCKITSTFISYLAKWLNN